MRTSTRSDETAVLRVWHELRKFHLDIVDRNGGDVFYATLNYDIAEEGVASVHATRVTPGRLLVALWRMRGAGVVEVNEPAYVRAWPLICFVAIASRLLRAVGRGPRDLVAYAIENGDPVSNLESILQRRWPIVRNGGLLRPIVRSVVGALFLLLDKVAYGSPGARELYHALVPYGIRRSTLESTRVQLPQACGSCDLSGPRRGVVFVGSFESRKGVEILMAAWERVMASATPQAELTMLGKGPLADDVAAWSLAQTVSPLVIIDPSDADIHRAYREAAVSVLLSQPVQGWREQIGLPILEGLAHCCEVVTTTETGLSEWLIERDFIVVDAADDVEQCADAIRTALLRARHWTEVRDLLPEHSSRLAADEWLMGVSA